MNIYSNYYQFKHITSSQLEVPKRLESILKFLKLKHKNFKEIEEYKDVNPFLQNLSQNDKIEIMNLLNKLTNSNFHYCNHCTWFTGELPSTYDQNYKNSKSFNINDNDKSKKLNIICEMCENNISDINVRHCYHKDNTDTSYNWNTHLVLQNMICTIYTSLVENIKDNQLVNDFMLLTRPPGHHSSTDTITGFCYMNWVYLMSQFLINTLNYKVCIIDLDLHHGNGTEIMVKDKENLLFLDLHYFARNFYPGTGNEQEFVANNIINVNMKKGSGDKEYLNKLQNKFDTIKNFNPDIFIISMGCDIIINDPFDIMKCSTSLYKQVYHLLKQTFAKNIILVLEGGYHAQNVHDTVKSFI
jgi:acetoin utilization deacetylase AcuC-like enzyme